MSVFHDIIVAKQIHDNDYLNIYANLNTQSNLSLTIFLLCSICFISKKMPSKYNCTKLERDLVTITVLISVQKPLLDHSQDMIICVLQYLYFIF